MKYLVDGPFRCGTGGSDQIITSPGAWPCDVRWACGEIDPRRIAGPRLDPRLCSSRVIRIGPGRGLVHQPLSP